MRVGRVIVVAALISGALAGLAGAGEVGGVRYQVTSDLSSGYGYAGIVIATLAELNPLGADSGGAVLRHHLQRRRHDGARHRRADLSRRVIQGVALVSHGGRAGCSRSTG